MSAATDQVSFYDSTKPRAVIDLPEEIVRSLSTAHALVGHAVEHIAHLRGFSNGACADFTQRAQALLWDLGGFIDFASGNTGADDHHEAE